MPLQKQCSNCNTPVEADSAFCTSCGTAIGIRKPDPSVDEPARERGDSNRHIAVGDTVYQTIIHKSVSVNIGLIHRSVKLWHALFVSIVVLASVAVALTIWYVLDIQDHKSCDLIAIVQPIGAGAINRDPLPPSDGRYTKGTRVLVTAIPAPGASYRFDYWVGVDGEDTLNPSTVTCVDDRRIIALFSN